VRSDGEENGLSSAKLSSRGNQVLVQNFFSFIRKTQITWALQNSRGNPLLFSPEKVSSHTLPPFLRNLKDTKKQILTITLPRVSNY
jgi:hypothetical protein